MLNDSIPEQLAVADRRIQRQKGLSAGLAALPWIFAALVLLLAVDVALQLRPGWRVGLGAAFLAALAILAGGLLYLAQVRRNRPEQIARLLESRDPALRSRLINFLQLQAQLQDAAQPPLTRALTEQAVSACAADLQTRDLRPLTKSPTLGRNLRYAGWAFGALLLVLGVLYPITALEALRFLDPFGDHPAYSFTQVEIVDPSEAREVDYGGSVTIRARTSGHRPDDLYLRLAEVAHPEKPAQLLPMYNKGEGGFMQEIENLRGDLQVSAMTKNGRSASKARLIRVGLVPRIEKAFVTVAPPPYTGLVAHEAPYDFKNLTALVGSEITFRLHSNRPLAGGSIALPEHPATAMTASADNEVSGHFTAQESTRLQFSVLDVLGNHSQENPGAPLTVTHDLPPTITIDTPAQDGFVCDDFMLEARLSASDDYGLKTIRIHRALNDVYSAPKTISFTEITRNAAETFTFNIRALGVQPGDSISFFAEAVDTCPEPHLARTETRRLTVISTEDYNDFLRERSDITDIQGKYSRLLNEFHDRIDEQKALTEKIRELEKKQAEAPNDPSAARAMQAEMDKLMAEQAELNKKLGALAEQMDHFVREKPLYDMETELQQHLSETAEKIRKSVEQSDEVLQKSLAAAGEQPSGGGAPQAQHDALANLEKDSQRQAQALEPEQRKVAEETMPPLKDAAQMNAIVNDFNAIKYLHETQGTVAAQTRAYQNRPNPTEEDRLALKQLAGTEKAIQWALDKVVENLRTHADKAEGNFPQAAQSARDLAAHLQDQKLSSLAGRTANSMLAGDGEQSAAQADRLQQELDQLFADAEPAQGGACKEFDKYLKLKRRMNSGGTFGQMAKSRKFGFGMGEGQQGKGQNGDSGLDGYASSSSGDVSIIGNETLGSDPESSGKGKNGAAGTADAGQKAEVNGTSAPATEEMNRLSGSTRSESTLEEYRSLIDAYFNSITK